jgi:hypothetical protein
VLTNIQIQMSIKYSGLKTLFLILPVLFMGCNAGQTDDSDNKRLIEKVSEFEPVTLMVQDIDFQQDVAIEFKEHKLLVSLNSVGSCGGDYSYTLPDLVSDDTGCVRSGETICSVRSIKYEVCFTALEFSETNRTAKTRVTLRQTKE